MDNIAQVESVEGALIGAILRDGRKYSQARDVVKPEDFGVYAYGYAWLACEHLHETGMAIDLITVGDELERMGKMVDFVRGMWSGRALLSDLRSNGEPRNVMDYAENVIDYSLKRKVLGLCQTGAAESMNGKRARDIIENLNVGLGELLPYSMQDEYTVPISKAVSEGYDLSTAASKGEIVGVPTGFIDIDKMLGSLYQDNVYLIAARPGQGKTALMLNVALNAARKFDKKIAIFSLEMSRAQVAQRLASIESEVDLSKIIRGKMSVEEWERYTKAIMVIEGLNITINDLSSINIQSIRNISRKIAAKNGLDLVLIDYVQLADAGGKKQTRELEVSEVSRGMKYLAREMHIPVLAAAQLSRAVEQRGDHRPVLSDLRESGSLEQDSYSVMFIHKPDEAKPSNTELIIAKHRNGPVGSIDLYWNAPFARFENATSRYFDTKG